jgi:deoxyadenosine/deoxycytidine kinase
MNRIEICGGIASGKTSFASVMDRLALEIILEDFAQNPFWKAFYTNPGKYIFETEIAFTLLHYHQIKKQIESGSEIIVCDFSFPLDLAYAKIGLTGSQLKTFERVYSEVRKELGSPSLLVHLKCDADTELARIRKRNRPEESSINLDFLDRLNKAVEKEVSMLQPKCPIITVDSAVKDFANQEATKEEMRQLIRSHTKKFNRL